VTNTSLGTVEHFGKRYGKLGGLGMAKPRREVWGGAPKEAETFFVTDTLNFEAN